jgi:hypothetical protein
VFRSPALLYESFRKQQGEIEAELLEAEKELHPAIAADAVETEVISRYLQTRLSAMDAWMGYGK